MTAGTLVLILISLHALILSGWDQERLTRLGRMVEELTLTFKITELLPDIRPIIPDEILRPMIRFPDTVMRA